MGRPYNLVVDDLSQMDGCGFTAMTTFQIFRHNFYYSTFQNRKAKAYFNLG